MTPLGLAVQERMEVIKTKQETLREWKAEIIRRMQARDNAQGSTEDIQALCERVQNRRPNLGYDDQRAFLEVIDIRILAEGNQITTRGLIMDAILKLGRYPTVKGVLYTPIEP